MELKHIKKDMIEVQATPEEIELLIDGIIYDNLDFDEELKYYRLICDFMKKYEELNEEVE